MGKIGNRGTNDPASTRTQLFLSCGLSNRNSVCPLRAADRSPRESLTI